MKPFTWSYSAYESYITCPRKYYETSILKKYIQPESAQQKWGNDVHKALELAVTIKQPLPGNMVQYQPLVNKFSLSNGEKKAELKLAINANGKAVDFFAKDVWCRGIVDLLIHKNDKGLALDYKTGKRKVDSTQLKLMSILTFAKFPEINRINTGFIWLKEGNKMDMDQFYKKDVQSMQESFRPVVTQMEYSYKNMVYPEKKNGLCREWCPVMECKYNGQYKK